MGAIDGAEAIYLNSGSWAPTWRKDRPDLTGKIIHSFIHFEREDGEYAARSLEWSDEREKPVEATITARRFSS